MSSTISDELTRPIIGIENRTAQEVFDIMCDRIRARSRNDGVRVKALEWAESFNRVKRATTILGDYRIWTHHEADGVVFWQLSDGGIKAGGQGTKAECLAAAQADYEQRILAALEPIPSEPTEQEVEAAVAAAVKANSSTAISMQAMRAALLAASNARGG